METIIFDVDGTLLSTEQMYIQALSVALEQLGIQRSAADLHHTFGLPGPAALAYLEIDNPKEVTTKWTSLLDDYRDQIYMYNGVALMLEQLAHKHQLGIATSNSPEEFAAHHDRFKIEQYFKTFVFAGMTPKMKPAGDPVLLAMHNLKGQADTTIYIGDTIHDLQAAHNAGVAFGLAAWGVDDITPFTEAEYIFQTPDELVGKL
ncbi:HAD family hydrolase [Weissella kandleri]|uniref:HAD family hydrolase n=1 Tax=Weissella kandleri TaxID=1616 RepID=UPI00387E7556